MVKVRDPDLKTGASQTVVVRKKAEKLLSKQRQMSTTFFVFRRLFVRRRARVRRGLNCRRNRGDGQIYGTDGAAEAREAAHRRRGEGLQLHT